MAFLSKTTNATLDGTAGVSGFPVILDHNFQVHTLSLQYFFDCLKTVEVSSVGTYGAHICDFVSQLEVDGKKVSEINDGWLKAYKQAIKVRNDDESHNTENYASQVCRTVIDYCLWLTKNNYEPYLCGPTKYHKIQITYSESNKVKHSTSENSNSDKRQKIAPRSNWIEHIKPFGPQTAGLAIRFELMIDWGRLGGLRAVEICLLKINSLPQRETAERALHTERLIPTNLSVSKGGRKEVVRVPPSLVLATWDYIDLYRVQTVRKFNRIHKEEPERAEYIEPSSIFLSDKTGQNLCPISFSISIRKAYLEAVRKGKLTEDERVWAHGLRHNFITKTLKANDEAGYKRPERLTMQSSRHSSLDAMEVYAGDRFSDDFN